MNLDDNYRIICDDFNFILQRKVKLRRAKRGGKTKQWKNLGYWKDLSQALASYARQVLRDDMPNTFAKLLSVERALGAQIEAIGKQCVSLWGKPE